MGTNIERFYIALEDRFRGSPDLIRERQKFYLPLVKRSIRLSHRNVHPEAFFLDIGCGRGEWLTLLKQEGISSVGVDTNGEMVATSKQKGLDAHCCDALEYLRGLPDESLLGASAFHVIEHVDLETGLNLLSELLRCLIPGGIAFFETPNTENFRVSTHNFFIDPTHTKPIPPILLQFMFEHTGFQGNEIVRLHPADDFQSKWALDGLASKIPLADATLFMLQHFCAAQDYAVIGVKGQPMVGLLPASQ